MRYIDTSALVPFYRPEANSDRCESALLDTDEELVLSDLTEVELASALARLVRMGEIDATDAGRIAAAFDADAASGAFHREVLTPSEMKRALDWLRVGTHQLRTLDALHLALAARLDAELVSGDARQVEAARALGIRVLWVGPGRAAPGKPRGVRRK